VISVRYSYAGTLDRREAERREGGLGFRHTGITTALLQDEEMRQPSDVDGVHGQPALQGVKEGALMDSTV